VKDAPEITPELVLNAYCSGVFPMADHAASKELFWVDPRFRGVLPLDRFHASASLLKRLRTTEFLFTVDRAFREVMRACADRAETWINDDILHVYGALHDQGYAHSLEVWQNGDLIGGLYGVSINAAFFGESMFSRRSDASKLALLALVRRLQAGGYLLLDTQFLTPHLASLGAIEISRKEFHRRLETALGTQANFYSVPDVLTSEELRQLNTQMS